MAEPADPVQEIVDNLPMMFFQKDTKNGIVRANALAAQSLGVTTGSMAGTDVSKWYPEEAEQYYRDDLEVIRTGEPKVGIIEPLRVEGGEKRWIRTDKFPIRDPSGRVSGLYVFISDASAEGLGKAALVRTEAKLRSILATIPEVVSVTSREGVVVEYFSGSTGQPVDPAHLVDRSLDEVVPPELAAQVRDATERALSTDEVQELDFSLSVGQQERWFSARGTQLVIDGNAHVLWCTRDVTRQREAEASRQLFEMRMQEGQRMESLGVLAGGIAHDFNNLLMGVLGNADLARDALPGDSPVLPLLDDINAAAEQMASLSRQMLAYSGRGTLAVEPLDLSRLVRDMAELLLPSLPSSVELAFALSEGDVVVEGDAGQLRQVVMNLVTNAAEAIGERAGQIALSSGVLEADTRALASSYFATALEPGRCAFVEVRDTGCGMDASTRSRIFEPFFTTRFTGRGLGLAATLGIVRGHRGAICVESEPGQGALFRLLLPLSDKPVASREQSLRAEAPFGERRTVLVIDDERAVRAVAERVLERAGFRVLCASGGEAGLRLLREHRQQIALVLLDRSMPRMSGEQTFERLRRIDNEVPVIFSSGYSEEELSPSLTARPPVGFIRKPYRSGVLLAAVRHQLDVDSTR